MQGPAPWTIVPPDGTLDLEIAGSAGEPIAATVLVGDHYEAQESGTVRLRGLPHGPVRCWIGASGHRSARVDVTLGAAPQTVRVELPERR